ncbi:MAG TPA: sigma-70 family RNA polymerase sigma factor [Longimicrobiales bacterium]|nr:sigma-70 family RNA polymerase sigma factor [Longimicrobiales bacterium]
MPPKTSEADLLERARAGDVEAREDLIRAHLDAVYRTALRVLRDPDAAADATQDTFVSAMQALGGFRGDSSVRTWLMRIAVNAARSIGRRRSRRREVALDVAADSPAAGDGAEARAVAVSQARRADAALALLPEKQRLCVSLRIQEDLGYAEIGRIVGCSEAAARVNYHYGLKRLREVLGDDDAM